jgi:hypothetical protein
MVQYHDRKFPQEDRNREKRVAAQGSLLLASPQQGVPPAGVSSRVLEAHGLTLGKLLLVWCSVILTLIQERCPFMVTRNVAGQCQGFLLSQGKELAHEAAD